MLHRSNRQCPPTHYTPYPPVPTLPMQPPPPHALCSHAVPHTVTLLACTLLLWHSPRTLPQARGSCLARLHWGCASHGSATLSQCLAGAGCTLCPAAGASMCGERPHHAKGRCHSPWRAAPSPSLECFWAALASGWASTGCPLAVPTAGHSTGVCMAIPLQPMVLRTAVTD